MYMCYIFFASEARVVWPYGGRFKGLISFQAGGEISVYLAHPVRYKSLGLANVLA